MQLEVTFSCDWTELRVKTDSKFKTFGFIFFKFLGRCYLFDSLLANVTGWEMKHLFVMDWFQANSHWMWLSPSKMWEYIHLLLTSLLPMRTDSPLERTQKIEWDKYRWIACCHLYFAEFSSLRAVKRMHCEPAAKGNLTATKTLFYVIYCMRYAYVTRRMTKTAAPWTVAEWKFK